MKCNMWILLVLPLCVFAGDFTEYTGVVNCKKRYFDQCDSPKIFYEISGEKRDFMASCRETLSYVKCSRDHDMTCLEEKERAFKEPQKYEHLYDWFDELCKEGTALNEVMTSNLKCFNETFSNPKCEQEWTEFYRKHVTRIQLDEFTTSNEIPERVSCLIMMLEANCYLNDITRNCGLRARFLSMEFLRITEYVDRFCPKSYREGLLEDIDEFNLSAHQMPFVISELERMKAKDEA